MIARAAPHTWVFGVCMFVSVCESEGKSSNANDGSTVESVATKATGAAPIATLFSLSCSGSRKRGR